MPLRLEHSASRLILGAKIGPPIIDARMRATFDHTGSGSSAQPANLARGPRRNAWWAVILVIAAFGAGTLAAAAYEVLSDIDARGEMEPTW
jgi:hypothetical protein